MFSVTSFILFSNFGNIIKNIVKLGDKMRKISTVKIGSTLKEIRRSNGYTQEKLAEEIEVSVRYISDIEQDRSKPSYEVLIRFCNLFKISMDQIFSKYISVRDNKTLEYSITGFDKLAKKDKETIENLIMYFNKSKMEK